MAAVPTPETIETVRRKRIPVRIWYNKLFKMGIYERGGEMEDLARRWVAYTIEDKNLKVKNAEVNVAVIPNDTFSEVADPRWYGAFYVLPSWHDGEVLCRHFFLVFPERVPKNLKREHFYKVVMHELAHAEECYVHGSSEDYTERFEQYLDLLGAPRNGDELIAQ